jgi:hypothetical protein
MPKNLTSFSSSSSPMPIRRSSLTDTIKVALNIEIPTLESLMADNDNIRRDGFRYRVLSPFEGVSANIFSRPDDGILYIEASAPKFLTGQNLIGIEDVHQASSEMIFAVLDRARIEPNRVARRMIRRGDYRLLRADVTAHCKFDSGTEAHGVMQALRRLAITKARDVSFYGAETIYINQHSTRRTLKIYRKDLELLKHPIPDQVHNRERLNNFADALLRFELTLRGEELKRLDLQDPTNWTPDTGRELLQRQFDYVAQAQGRLPTAKGIDQLPRLCQAKLRLWLLGHAAAFSDSPTTYPDNRRQVLVATGIDISSPLELGQQRAAVRTVGAALRAGIGFKAHPKAWERLKANAASASGR